MISIIIFLLHNITFFSLFLFLLKCRLFVWLSTTWEMFTPRWMMKLYRRPSRWTWRMTWITIQHLPWRIPFLVTTSPESSSRPPSLLVIRRTCLFNKNTMRDPVAHPRCLLDPLLLPLTTLVCSSLLFLSPLSSPYYSTVYSSVIQRGIYVCHTFFFSFLSGQNPGQHMNK